MKNILHFQAGSGPGIQAAEVNVVFTTPAGKLKAFRQGYGCREYVSNCRSDKTWGEVKCHVGTNTNA